MTMLGNVQLSGELILRGLETSPDLAWSQRRYIGGAFCIQTDGMVGGRTLRLIGKNHFTLADIQAVKALAALRQPVTLTHSRGTFTVLITETPVEPAFEHVDPNPEDWYSGEITLLEVD